MPVQFLGSLGFKTAAALNSESILKASRFSKYSRPPVTRTLKGGGEGERKTVRVSGEFELSG